MKKMRIFIFLILSLLLTNCNKEEKKAEDTVVETQEEKIDDTVIENKKIRFSDKAYKLFEDFANSKKNIIKKLKSANKEEGNKLYEQYIKDTQIILNNIDSETWEFLENIYSYENEEDNFI